jgi:hypothetical protein
LGRVASFVHETRTLVSAEVEDRIEELCLKFEALKPYLASQWNREPTSARDGTPSPDVEPQLQPPTENVEV